MSTVFNATVLTDKLLSPDESITPEDLPFKLCPSNSEYIVYEGNCFKVAQVASTHGTARDKCEEDGAMLASVADGYEQAFIEMLMVYYNIETAWIGLTRGVSALRGTSQKCLLLAKHFMQSTMYVNDKPVEV